MDWGDRADGETEDGRPRRYVDKSLAEGFDFDDEREDDEDDEDGPTPAPPPWPAPDEPTPAPPPWPAPDEPAPAPAPPSSVHPCWSCAAPVPSGAPACPECQESPRHLWLISTRPPVDLRHGAGSPLNLGRHPGWAAPAVATALDGAPGVSRRHASVELAPDGGVWLTEHPHGTTNGTYVNDERVPAGTRVPLSDGDMVGLGRHCAFRLVLVEPPTG
ncbi:FHA domain-containing protein [Streptomyces sp. NPDC088812]|uniref:FHA domain-containing protein n=1 Tax=Streptomyces sp. NPDC088812 TaxID=3365905 RepID=UPI0037F5A4C5